MSFGRVVVGFLSWHSCVYGELITNSKTHCMHFEFISFSRMSKWKTARQICYIISTLTRAPPFCFSFLCSALCATARLFDRSYCTQMTQIINEVEHENAIELSE